MARILLVDDDFDIRELGRALLAHAGHDVQTADGAMNALIIMRENEFDMIVTDVNMPNHNGFDFLKMVRLEGTWPSIVKVMLTGRREKRDVEAAGREGVHAYIVKPLDPEVFVEKIEALLEEREMIKIPTVEFSMQAQVEMSVEITSVSDMGIRIFSPYQFRSGTLIPLSSAIFQRIGIAMPLTRVFLSQKKDGGWETNLNYVDLNDEDARKLRLWTDQQQPKSTNQKRRKSA